MDVGTVSLRFSSDGLERFYECLVCLSAREPLTSLRSVRTRPWAFGFQGMPFQVVLSDAELGNLVTAVESAVRLLKKLQLGTELRCKN